jgi:hypothetical protein
MDLTIGGKMTRVLLIACIGLMSVGLIACDVTVNIGSPPEPTQAQTLPEGISKATTGPGEQPENPIPWPTEPPGGEVTVYFTDQNNFASGVEPYEAAVTRKVNPPSRDYPVDYLNEYYPLQVLREFFNGPTAEEAARGLILVSSGFTYVRDLVIDAEGVAHVRLGATCANNGAAYSVGNLIFKNLEQFPEVKSIKIYDENDSTLTPEGTESSYPYCLEP